MEELESKNGLVRIRNLAREGRNPEVPVLEGWVEQFVVRRLLRGADVKIGSAKATGAVLLFHDDRNLSVSIPVPEVRDRFPKAYEYVRNFETFLRQRKKFRNFDPSGDDWLGAAAITPAAISLITTL